MKNPERFNAFLSRVCLKKESARVIVDYVRPPALPVSRVILFPPKAAPLLIAAQAINGRTENLIRFLGGVKGGNA
jgi:hypothetical protein